MTIVDQFDQLVDDMLDHLRGHAGADRVFYGLSELGDFSLLWHLLGAVRALRADDPLRDVTRVSVLLGLESALVNGGMKSLFRRDRPDHDHERPHRLRQPRTSSFPSGHATAAMVAAAILSEDTRLKPAIYALGGAVALSRVHVRIHHASDVAAGLAIGIGLGALARRAWPRTQ